MEPERRREVERVCLASLEREETKSLFFYYWRFEEAGEQFTRSLELNPRLAEAHYWYGFWLSSMGRHAESMREMELACELDPLSTPNRQGLGWVCFLAKQFDRAIAECPERA